MIRLAASATRVTDPIGSAHGQKKNHRPAIGAATTLLSNSALAPSPGQ
jgi:hypothetical protein